MLRVHRALWAAIECREELVVEPLSSWAILRRYARRAPQPGEGMAVNVARTFLAREDRTRSILGWHAANFGLTAWLTRVATAEQLVVLYASNAHFGRGTMGVGQAAWAWFGARPEDLTWGQAALLATLEEAPGSLDPRCAPERALRRRHWVLERLAASRAMTPRALADADAEPLLPRAGACPEADVRACRRRRRCAPPR